MPLSLCAVTAVYASEMSSPKNSLERLESVPFSRSVVMASFMASRSVSVSLPLRSGNATCVGSSFSAAILSGASGCARR